VKLKTYCKYKAADIYDRKARSPLGDLGVAQTSKHKPDSSEHGSRFFIGRSKANSSKGVPLEQDYSNDEKLTFIF